MYYHVFSIAIQWLTVKSQIFQYPMPILSLFGTKRIGNFLIALAISYSKISLVNPTNIVLQYYWLNYEFPRFFSNQRHFLLPLSLALKIWIFLIASMVSSSKNSNDPSCLLDFIKPATNHSLSSSFSELALGLSYPYGLNIPNVNVVTTAKHLRLHIPVTY